MADELQLNIQYTSKLAHQHYVAVQQYQAIEAKERGIEDALRQDGTSWFHLSSGGFLKVDQVDTVLQQVQEQARRSKSVKLEQMQTSQRRLKAAPWEEIGPDVSAAILALAGTPDHEVSQ